ncbi:glycosyltransferase family 39 protein [Pedobacter sp. PWIIR3]
MTQKFANSISLKLTFYLLAVLFVAMLLMRIIIAGSLHTDLGGIEQNVVFSIQKLLYDGQIYTDPGKPPFSITQYTPLFHIICFLTAKILNISPSEGIHEIYIIGRLWNVVFNLITSYILFQFATKILNVPKLVSIILAFSGFIFVFRQGFTVRPDSMMDMMLISSAYFFAKNLKSEQNGNKELVASIIISVLAIFSKQSAIQMPIILLGFLVFTGDWHRLKIGILTALISFILACGIFYLMYGNIFFLNVVGGLANGIDTSWFWKYIFGNGFKIKILIPFIIVIIVSFYKLRAFRGSKITRFMIFCALGMFAFASVTILKSGSNVEYYFPFCLMSLLLIMHVTLMENNIDKLIHKATFVLFVGYLLIVSLMNTFYQYKQVKELEFQNKANLVRKETEASDAANYILKKLSGKSDYVFANLDDEVVLDSVNSRRGINNILFKHAVIPQMDIYKSSNVKSAVLDYQAFANLLKSGEVKYFIESRPIFKFKIIDDLENIRENYFVLEKQIGAYDIFVYKSR